MAPTKAPPTRTHGGFNANFGAVSSVELGTCARSLFEKQVLIPEASPFQDSHTHGDMPGSVDIFATRERLACSRVLDWRGTHITGHALHGHCVVSMILKTLVQEH
jgi:hypothetical protein